MPYTQLEQFLDRGQEKLLWSLSYWNVAGLIGGYMAGSLLATTLGWGEIMLTLLSMIGGVVLSLNYRGIIIARRLWIYGRFRVRQVVTPAIITAQERGEVHLLQDEQAIQFRHVVDGRVVFGIRQYDPPDDLQGVQQ